ncbi:unnamed protein product [Meganyctiphanes norvegica]|uniref:DUF5641 domain-containing protein n=1 Tax=Meganyctiphanes norvegica TaxID=48144 RepID=A0AAV2SIQ5_MEGNR
MYKVIGKEILNYYQMITVLSDVENAVNDRPLTYRCVGNSGLEIITPNSFIKPYVSDNLLFNNEDESLLTKKPPARRAIINLLENRDNMLLNFKKLWYEEYLVSLRERFCDLHEVKFENRIKVDDIVLVKGKFKEKKIFWKLGRVQKIYPGDDGKVRSARVKASDGNISLRTINHLFPMELSLTHSHTSKRPNVEEILDLVEEGLSSGQGDSAETSGVGWVEVQNATEEEMESLHLEDCPSDIGDEQDLGEQEDLGLEEV